MDEQRYWGHSEVLKLDLCWEYGQLRWYDPASQLYIANYDEQVNARIAAEGQASIEHDARLAAERQADIEREARLAAEARVRELEVELGAQGNR